MAFQAVLVYDMLTGYQNNAALMNKDLTPLSVSSTLEALGFDRVGDMTVSTSGLTLRRTITVRTNAVGDRLWNSADQVKAITMRLFRGGLAMLLPSVVTASDPVVTEV